MEDLMMGIGITELFFAFVPVLIMLGISIFMIYLFIWLLRAEEKIADKMNDK